jgi:hypothetical protein
LALSRLLRSKEPTIDRHHFVDGVRRAARAECTNVGSRAGRCAQAWSVPVELDAERRVVHRHAQALTTIDVDA